MKKVIFLTLFCAAYTQACVLTPDSISTIMPNENAAAAVARFAGCNISSAIAVDGTKGILITMPVVDSTGLSPIVYIAAKNGGVIFAQYITPSINPIPKKCHNGVGGIDGAWMMTIDPKFPDGKVNSVCY